MSSLSHLIEQHILSFFENQSTVLLSRGDLANKFSCSPSQVTYVISSRFTLERGYSTTSRRGGAGYIQIDKIAQNDNYLNNLIADGIGHSLTLDRAKHICMRMLEEGVVDQKEYLIMNAALSDKALNLSGSLKDILRAKMLKTLIEELLKE